MATKLTPISINLKSHQGNIIPLGEICRFQVTSGDQLTETRAFITCQQVHYLKPLSGWNSDADIFFFPECPGQYSLNLEWKNQQDHGWLSYSFEVTPNLKIEDNLIPSQVEIVGNIKLWAPSKWEAMYFQGHENNVLLELHNIIHRGWVIYDVGANLGVFSTLFSKLAGNNGSVYCIEPNPLCLYFLRLNLWTNNCKNVTILPVGLSDLNMDVDFTINYGNSNLGLTNQAIFYQSKIGHNIKVQCVSLDSLISEYDLLPSNFIKIDIEGAEEFAIIGMINTIEKYHPYLLLELHGQKAV